jgi:hypothetical protein
MNQNRSTAPATQQAPEPQALSLTVTDIAGRLRGTISLDRAILVGDAAAGLAARLQLPEDTPWTIRDEQTGAFLDDNQALGTQFEGRTEVRVVVTPKAHLG